MQNVEKQKKDLLTNLLTKNPNSTHHVHKFYPSCTSSTHHVTYRLGHSFTF